jgi:hypothetical protein
MSRIAKTTGTIGGGSSVISYSSAAKLVATKERRPLARPVADDARMPRFSETISAKQYSSGAARAFKNLGKVGADFRGANAQAWQTRQRRAKSVAFIILFLDLTEKKDLESLHDELLLLQFPDCCYCNRDLFVKYINNEE